MRLAEGIILSHVDDGAIVLDSNRGVYFRLNRTASSVLEMLLSGLSKEETAKRISVSMEADEGEVLNDIDSIVAQMSEASFLSGVTDVAIPVGPEASVRITLSERARALFAVGAGSLVARMSPRRICNFLEWVGRKSDPADAVQAGRARYAVCAVSARCSGMGCLLRSVSAFIYCRCQGTSPDWCSGFRTSPFAAHAWIEVDGCPVGEPGSLSSFVTVLSVRPHRHDAEKYGMGEGTGA